MENRLNENGGNQPEDHQPGLGWALPQTLLFVVIPLTLLVAGFLIWHFFDYSLFELGSSPMSMALTFFGVFVLSQVFHRFFYHRKGVTQQLATKRQFEVQVPKGLKTQMLISIGLLSVLMVVLLTSLNFSSPIRAVIGIAALCLLPFAMVNIVHFLYIKVSISQENEQLELQSFTKGKRLIPLSSIQDIQIRRSLEAKLTGDRPGDVLIVHWLTNRGELKKDSITLNRCLENRDLLFSILKGKTGVVAS